MWLLQLHDYMIYRRNIVLETQTEVITARVNTTQWQVEKRLC